MKKLLSILLLIPFSLFCGEGLTRINKAALISANRLGVYHDGESFHVKEKGRLHRVERYDLDENMRKITPQNLPAYLKAGKIKVSKLSNGDFALRSHIPGLGGGPISGAIAYWTVKTLCWAGIATAGAAVVVAPATMPFIITGATAAGGGAAVAAAAPVVAAVVADAAAITATTAVVAETAALTTASVMGGAGGVMGGIAAIESASTGAGLFFTAIPFLP